MSLPAGQQRTLQRIEQTLVAGDPEQIARAERIDTGIEIDDTTWSELSAIAERYQVHLDS